MKAYVVNVKHNDFENKKTCSRGYTTLERAQAFVESRHDKPLQRSPWEYTGTEYKYEIVEVAIY